MEHRLTVMDYAGNPVGEAVLHTEAWQKATTITLPAAIVFPAAAAPAKGGIRAGILRADWPVYDHTAFASILPAGHAVIAEKQADLWVECLIEGPDMPLPRADGSYETVELLVGLDTRLAGHDHPELLLYWAHLPDRKWRVPLDKSRRA